MIYLRLAKGIRMPQILADYLQTPFWMLRLPGFQPEQAEKLQVNTPVTIVGYGRVRHHRCTDSIQGGGGLLTLVTVRSKWAMTPSASAMFW